MITIERIVSKLLYDKYFLNRVIKDINNLSKELDFTRINYLRFKTHTDKEYRIVAEFLAEIINHYLNDERTK